MPDLHSALSVNPVGDLSRRIISIHSLSPHAEQALHRVGQRRKWGNGKTLLVRGQPSPAAILVLSGRLRGVTSTPDGAEHLMRWIEPGELTGLTSVFTETPFPADLVASGPTEVLHIERHRLIELIRTDGETAFAIVRVLSLRVSQLMEIITDQALISLEDKVWAALQRLSQFHGKAVREGVELRVSQSDIAHAVAASRQRVNMQLRRLQERGLIRLGYRNLLLFDRSGAQKKSR